MILFIIVTGGLLVAAVLKTYLGVDIQAIFARGGVRGIVQVSCRFFKDDSWLLDDQGQEAGPRDSLDA